MATVLRPPTDLENLVVLVAVLFCFVLAMLSIHYSNRGLYVSSLTSLLTAFFFVLIVLGLRGYFGLRVRNV
jgi:hypothetical protein